LHGYANAHIENVELRKVGQQTDNGRYPVHFHLCLDKIESAAQPYIKGNAIHDSFARCTTIHGTHGVLVSYPVQPKIAGYFDVTSTLI